MKVGDKIKIKEDIDGHPANVGRQLGPIIRFAGLIGTVTELRPENRVLIRFNDANTMGYYFGYEEFDIMPSENTNFNSVLKMLSHGTYQNNYEVDKDHD